MRMRWHTDAHLVNGGKGSSSDFESLKIKSYCMQLRRFKKFVYESVIGASENIKNINYNT